MKVSKSTKKSLPKKATREIKAVRPTSNKSIDPLYVIFEQHLFNFADPDSDRKTFIAQVVADYIGYLRKNSIIVPKSLEQPIVEELGTQVNTMLVRKIYGCLTLKPIPDAVSSSKKRAKTRVSKVG